MTDLLLAWLVVAYIKAGVLVEYRSRPCTSSTSLLLEVAAGMFIKFLIYFLRKSPLRSEKNDAVTLHTQVVVQMLLSSRHSLLQTSA